MLHTTPYKSGKHLNPNRAYPLGTFEDAVPPVGMLFLLVFERILKIVVDGSGLYAVQVAN